MRVDIVVVYVPRYRRGHEFDFVPPITGIHLAALTPPRHSVRVIHQQVQEVDLETDADLIALSFFSGFAPEAYRLARIFRSRGKQVVAGGPHVTYSADEALEHVDAVVIGEADGTWTTMLDDAANGCLQRTYIGTTPDLKDLPTPRYDLLTRRFFVPRVVQATRGCPFRCSFCTVPTLNPGFRTRPVADVLRDVAYDGFPHWWQRKVVWFWDDNLTIRRPYARELLTAMVPMKRWWLTQASLDIAKDDELLDLMKASGCIGIFFGIETFDVDGLAHANKRQNKVREYEDSIRKLHARGICVMAGFIAGFDGDTPERVERMADDLYEIGVDVPFLSILTPFRGTPLYEAMIREGRMLPDRGWEVFNGYHETFRPSAMEPDDLVAAHRRLWRKAFSPRHTTGRMLRAFRYLRPGALMMALTMNGFYGLKRLRENLPVNMLVHSRYRNVSPPNHVSVPQKEMSEPHVERAARVSAVPNVSSI
jgi:radical SAM superfamily enzyme YgiQ (UPF0313 family)